MQKNKKIAGVAGLAAIMAVGGTFAYFNQTMTVTNPFDTGKYDTTITEDFKPGDGEKWEPGAEVDKDVTVKNTGDYDVLVRVKFDEKWVNKENKNIAKENQGMDDSTYQKDATDGLTEADGSVVAKKLDKTNWVYNEDDGYWYYNQNLTAGTDTGKFLDSVKLLEDADMGSYIVTNYYTTKEIKPAETVIGDENSDPSTCWVPYTGEVPKNATHNMVVTKQNPEKPGYGNADYTLTITAQTVQATEVAMKDTFKLDSAPTGCTWNLTQNK